MDIFYALAEPTRRSIVELLASHGRLTVTEISGRFPVSPPAISQHLRVLREAKLVRVERHAQQRIYELDPEGVRQLETWARRMQEQWDERFEQLDRVLEAEKQKSRAEQQHATTESQEEYNG